MAGISVYTTCPASNGDEGHAYLEKVRRISRWSDDAGCLGTLVYSDNSLLDPWIVAHEILTTTRRLAPLVAVQPLYMHPFTVAKAVASFAHLFERRVALNFVAGGFPFDLIALGDKLDHDRRYDRLAEYGRLVVDLLRGSEPITAAGEFYDVRRLRLGPLPRPELMPLVMVSGSSRAGQRCAEKIGAIAVEYPRPNGGGRGSASARSGNAGLSRRGIRVGVLARESRAAAWAEATARFPDDPSGRQQHDDILASSDSHWHHQLSYESDAETIDGVYWLGPYKTHKTFCPYLVGSHADVGHYLRRYLRAGHHHVILDKPRSRDDLMHILRAFEFALNDE
ncbi:MAG TPA: LLM class flavin-dependent oxidoreductase [Gaiellaceae bacterium]|nr:LLM class flavin-dependent oxidoreductase [Gaiellaceae bacterium]